MDWLEKFNAVIDYIEAHISAEIDYATLASLACCSEFHFSRMFSSIVGISLSEYIRRRRLTIAAFEIQTGNEKIIDIAIKYGYDSPDAFTRAFRLLHGITPSAAKENGAKLKAYPRLTLQISIKGDKHMEYRIEKIDFNLRLVGKGFKVKTSNAFKQIPVILRNAKKDGYMQKLIEMSWKKPKCKLQSLSGVCGKEAAIMDDEFIYFYGVRYDGKIPKDMEELIIKPCTYAVFPNIVEAWKRLYSEWVPTSGYELADSPCIEHFLGPGHKIKHELWVPIIEKRNK